MNRILFLILVFIGFSICGNAQNYIPYYNQINEAEYDVYNQDFIKAASKYDAAFKLEKPHARDAYLLAYCLSEIDSTANVAKIKKLLLEASKVANSIPEFLSVQPLKIDLDSVFIAELEKNSEKWTERTSVLRDTADYFSRPDQSLLKFFQDSIIPEMDETRVVQLADFEAYFTLNDSIKQVEFLNYLKTNAYPGLFSSGTDLTASILTRIHESLYVEYEQVLFEELKKGHIQPYFYGLMIDMSGCRRNNKSFYGTTDPTQYCQPPSNEIIFNRLNIGMSPYFKDPRRSVIIGSWDRLDFE